MVIKDRWALKTVPERRKEESREEVTFVTINISFSMLINVISVLQKYLYLPIRCLNA